MFARVRWFALGLICGAGVIFVGLKYHVVHAQDGIHLVPKVSADFSEPYVDVRQFQVTDWNEHPELAAALVKAEKGHLVADGSVEAVRQTMDRFFDRFNQSEEPVDEQPSARFGFRTSEPDSRR